MKIYWQYHTEKYTKNNKEHVDHLWYISMIDQTQVDFGYEAEIDRIDDGVFKVILYKGEPYECLSKKKTKEFKTLAAAKIAVKAYMHKAVDEHILKMLTVKKSIAGLKCNE